MGRTFLLVGERSGSMRGGALSAALSFLLLVAFASCSGTVKPPPPPGLTNTVDAGGDFDATTPAGGDDSSVVTPPPVDASGADQSTVASVDASDAAPEASQVAPAGCVSTDPDASDVKPMMCGTQCVNVDTDPKNCGGCSQPCVLAGEVCDFGMCQCPATQTVCNNQCVDLNSDPSNCSYCGHNCQSNPCSMGVCQPSVIANLAVSGRILQSFAIDSSTVYWTEGAAGAGGVYSKGFSGATLPNPIGSSIDPRGIVVDLTYAYWVDYTDGSLTRSALIGGSPTLQSDLLAPFDAGTTPGPLALAVDANNVYWVDSAGGTVNKMLIGGGTATPLTMGEATPRAIAVDKDYVYWIDYGSQHFSGSVNKIPIDPIDGGSQPITSLATSEDEPYSIAINATTVFWTNRVQSVGTVRSAPIGGGGPIKTLAQGQGAPDGIAIDSQYVYWTNYDDNTVMKVPLAGGNVFTIASGQNNPTTIIVDNNSVYWANQASGQILKVAK